MKEYKRQRKDLEEQVSELQKRCEYHDDHLRAVDAWFAQLLDEVRITAGQMLPKASSISGMRHPASLVQMMSMMLRV